MSAIDFNDLKRHIGHNIVCVSYGQTKVMPYRRKGTKGKFVKRSLRGEIQNVALECEDCNEVLLDFDRESVEE